ncbi:MAG: hypothetical protein Q8Q09_05610 [Deltaproteobacteria bacterium]|nr:hypothetical protein [Deltaproteobacteria bacterium]
MSTLIHPVAPQRGRWTDWLFSFGWLRFALYLMVLHTLMPSLFANARHVLDYMDDHTFHHLELANKITVLEYHQLPAWNPFFCGGNVGLAGPEDSFYAPDTLLRWFFDVGMARHLTVLLGLFLGAEGTFRLARATGSSGLASLSAALIMLTNSVIMPLWITNGFFNFTLGFGLLPWVCWCLLMGVDKPAYRYLGGFFFAWIFTHAGTYPAPYTLLVVGFLTFSMALMKRNEGDRAWLTPFVSATVLGVVFVLLALAKFVPLMLFLKQFSRTWAVIEQHPAPTIFSNFTGGYIPILVLAGLAPVLRDRWGAVFALGAGLFFVLAMGDFDPLSPYHLLKQLPLFKQLRSPERHVILVIQFLVLGAARTITLVEDAIAQSVPWALGASSLSVLPRSLRIGAVALGTACAAGIFAPKYVQMVKQSAPSYASVQYSFEPARHMQQPFRQQRGNRRDGHVFPAMHAGSLACITGIPVPQSRLLRGDLQAEEYPLDPALATVRRVYWSPNAITLDVTARRATRVLINQNYHRYWRSREGTVVSHQGLLAVNVPAGQHRVTLRFVDWPSYIAASISLLTLLGLLGLLARYAWTYLLELARPFGSKNTSKPNR